MRLITAGVAVALIGLTLTGASPRAEQGSLSRFVGHTQTSSVGGADLSVFWVLDTFNGGITVYTVLPDAKGGLSYSKIKPSADSKDPLGARPAPRDSQ